MCISNKKITVYNCSPRLLVMMLSGCRKKTAITFNKTYLGFIYIHSIIEIIEGYRRVERKK